MNMKNFSFAKEPQFLPELDTRFRPIIVANKEYKKALKES
jgi:hypothetical protein